MPSKSVPQVPVSSINSRSARSCSRLDPGEGRVRTARSFRRLGGRRRVQLARGPARGLRPARRPVVTAFADNEVGHLVEDLIHQGGVDVNRSSSGCRTTASAAAVRNGLNFTERGFGVRAAPSAVPTAATPRSPSSKPGDVDWDHLFGERGRPLAPHRRHLRRCRASDRRRSPSRPSRPPRSTARSSPTTSTTVLAVEGHRRPHEGAGGQPRDRASTST